MQYTDPKGPLQDGTSTSKIPKPVSLNMANATKLNAAVDRLHDLEEKVSVFQDGQEKQVKVNRYLWAKVNDLQEKLDAVTDHIQFLESVLELEDLVEQEPGGGKVLDCKLSSGKTSQMSVLKEWVSSYEMNRNMNYDCIM